MREIKIENITFNLLNENNNVRVKSDNIDVILVYQNVDTVSELLKYNFNLVKNHYKLMAEKTKNIVNYSDITHISITIVLHYLYMYNSWRFMYKKQENKDLRFNEKDFVHPYTHDIIFNYFKVKYPNDWEKKCSVLLGVELNELKAYYKTREEYYNK
jgi:muramoyltetrapeptide carboxypeptidase LdcA involved in peptidoglycan recycling